MIRMSTSNFFSNPFGAQDEEQGLMDEACQACKLTKTQRMYGFGFSFTLGFVLSFIGTLTLMSGALVQFAVLYSLGNILSLMSTGFLIGPMQQLKNMFAPVRMVATIVFLVSMACTLIFALVLTSPIAIIFVIIQYCAFIWYCASYIPFARAAIKKCLGNACGDII